MRDLIVFFSLIIFYTSSSQNVTREYFKNNIAIMDSYLKANDDNRSYKSIIVIKDFSDSPTYPESISHKDIYYLHTKDGVFISKDDFTNLIDEVNNKNGIYDIMKKPFVTDKEFKFKEKVQNYAKSGPGGEISGELSCDIEFGTCGCRADRWGWCDCCCFSLSNCEVTIGGSLGI